MISGWPFSGRIVHVWLEDAAWDPGKHPKGPDGKFVGKGGSSALVKKESAKLKPLKTKAEFDKKGYKKLKNIPITRMREYTEKEFPWEYREYTKYAKHQFPSAFNSEEDFKERYEAAPLLHLTKSELLNLGYSSVNSYMKSAGPEAVHKAMGHRRDTKKIAETLIQGRSAPPIVLRHKGGLRILGGNTRVSMAAALGLNVPVKLIDITHAH